MAFGRAALGAGLPGRAVQAAQLAAASGAAGDGLSTLREAARQALTGGADTAFDLYQLGLIRKASGDRFGARDALQRALRKEGDGSLRKGERSLIAAALRQVR